MVTPRFKRIPNKPRFKSTLRMKVKDSEDLWNLLVGWTDRLLPPESKKDPQLHLQAQLALFFAVPGAIVSVGLISLSLIHI